MRRLKSATNLSLTKAASIFSIGKSPIFEATPPREVMSQIESGRRRHLTNDTRLGHWIADPGNSVPRAYVATVRGRVSEEECGSMVAGVCGTYPPS